MKKVVFLLSDITIPGGIQRVVSQLVNELVITGKYKITLLSLFQTNTIPYFNLDKDIKLGYLFKEKFGLRKNYFKVAKSINAFIKDNEVDVFVNAGMGYVPISYWATRKVKTISWEHSNVLIGKKFGLTWWGRLIASKKSDCLVVITKEDMENYKYRFNKINRIEQIYNPIESEPASNEYVTNTKKIMSCGTLVYQKGFDILIEVAKLVFEKYPDWTWEIYGDGPKRQELERSIAENRLEGKVLLKGYVKNIDEYYKKHSIFVLTSRYEGFGMVLVEAQKSNLPIVAFKCPCGPSEIIADRVNGLLVECFDIKQMADSICFLLENSDIRKGFSKRSHEKLHYFDVKVISERWCELIDSL